jgi:hypothetical protein
MADALAAESVTALFAEKVVMKERFGKSSNDSVLLEPFK